MTGSYAYLLIKAVLTLGVVLALLALCVYAVRLYMNGRGGAAAKDGAEQGGAPVRVLHTSFLGAKKNLAIVEVAGEVLVLGVTATNINFLARIEDGAAVEALRKNRGRRSPLLKIFNGGL